MPAHPGGLFMSDEPIPLFDGEPSGSVILPERGSSSVPARMLRSRRVSPRKGCENVHVCFSPETPSGLVDNAECPLINISSLGMAVEYDKPLRKGTSAHVSYYSITRIPVHVGCMVRHCDTLDNGRYLIGLRMSRTLKYEERKPMRVGHGRVVSPTVRARKLKPAIELTPAEPRLETRSPPGPFGDGAIV